MKIEFFVKNEKKYTVNIAMNDHITTEKTDSVIKTLVNGDKHWYKNEVLHRGSKDDHKNLPAIERVNGDKEWWVDGLRHRRNQPAVELADGTREYWTDGKLGCPEIMPGNPNIPVILKPNGDQKWYCMGVLGRDANTRMAPSIIRANGDKEWYNRGFLHRDLQYHPHHYYDGNENFEKYVRRIGYTQGGNHDINTMPAIERANGDKEWWINGQRHRDFQDLPAVELANGDKEWWFNGQRHRDNDKPAVEYANGNKEWFRHGVLHRYGDLPAIEFATGGVFYCKLGSLHRDNNLPAVIYSNGEKEWWVNGERIIIEEFVEIVNNDTQ